MGIGSLRSACSASSRLIRVRPNLAEVVPIPFEHRLSKCICNAYADEATRTGPDGMRICYGEANGEMICYVICYGFVFHLSFDDTLLKLQ